MFRRVGVTSNGRLSAPEGRNVYRSTSPKRTASLQPSEIFLVWRHIALLQSAGITCDELAIDIRPLCGQADLSANFRSTTTSLNSQESMYAKAPYTVVLRAMHIHPTVAEYLPTVLSKLEPFA